MQTYGFRKNTSRRNNDEEAQKELLNYLKYLKYRRYADTAPKPAWTDVIGSITDEEADTMMKAIEEGCGKIDVDE